MFSQGRNGIRGVHFRLLILKLFVKFCFQVERERVTMCSMYKLLEIVTNSILTRARVLQLKLGLRLLCIHLSQGDSTFDGNFTFDFNRR